MITVVFFDANGVLYDRHETPEAYALRLLAVRGYPSRISSVDNARLRTLHARASTGQLTPKAYWDEFLRAYGVASAEARAEMATLILVRAHDVYEMPGTRATLCALKRRGFTVGVITNTMHPPQWKRSWLEKIGVAEYVDVLVCSTEVGVEKPAPQIYLHALNRASVLPSQAVFVGHAPEELEGARSLGMATVAVNYAPGTRADFHIAALPDLLAIPILRRRSPDNPGA
ncbi:MAG: HAD family hydrolase [Armatimonadota bacterium]|nr:HAD family hydrolase [Armatimonadota bacterium]MDR7471272.1 HAD family hydrolase [Armatimonadota bacterium]